MRIVIVTHRVVRTDGQGRVNYEIAKEALRKGHDVVLVSSDAAAEMSQHPRVDWQPVPVSRWPSALIRNQVFALRSARRLRALRGRADAIVVNGFITWADADVNVAHFVHGTWKESSVRRASARKGLHAAYQWLYSALNAHWEKRAFAQAAVTVAVSERIRVELLRIGVDPDRIRVIENGVDARQYAPGRESRSRFGLPENVPVAVFVGDIRTPRKNLDGVLRALVHVPALHLAVAGRTEGSPFPEEARRLGLSGRVHFLGFRDDVDRLMRTADLCVCPSRYEPFSLVLLEALASGLPVVTTAHVGAASLLDESAGRIIPDPDDHLALASALADLAADAALRNRMGEAARRVAEQHTWEGAARRYLELIEEVAAAAAASEKSEAYAPAHA